MSIQTVSAASIAGQETALIEQKWAGVYSGYPAKGKRTVRAYLSRHYASILFAVIFLVPTIAAVLFYGFLAADRYVSETRFIVRGPDATQSGSLSAPLRTLGVVRSDNDAYAIHSYILSRDAIAQLQGEIDLRAIYGRPEADYLTRFGTMLTGNSAEQFYDYYRRQITVERDLEAGITTLKVSAYRAGDAQTIAARLLTLGEQRVNAMNARGRADTVRQAEQTLAEASDAVVKSQRELKQFGAASGTLPAGDSSASEDKTNRYQELLLRRTLADNAYQAASDALGQARKDAARKQIYLEAIVQPSLPDEAMEPRRFRMMFTVALLSFASFVMAYMLVSGSREHLNSH